MNSTSLTEPSAPETPAYSLALPVIISLGIAAALFLLSAWAWQQLPPDARIPMHWNAEGKVDGYGSRSTLFIMPGTVLGLTLLLALLPRLEPRRAHLLLSIKAYRAVWLAVLGLLGGMQVLVVQAALGKPVAMDKFLCIGVGVLMVVIGNFLGKVRSNYVFGVRTPWTLSSELSWNKTHRLAGRLFVIFGMIVLGAALLPFPRKYILFADLALLAVILVTVFVYSYAIWRQDPERNAVGRRDSTGK